MRDSAPAEEGPRAQQTSFESRVLAVARWMASVALLVLAPKCALCVVGYLGLAAVLGSAGVELCGGSAAGNGFLSWTLGPMWAAVVLGAVVGGFFARRLPALIRVIVSGSKRVVR